MIKKLFITALVVLSSQIILNKNVNAMGCAPFPINNECPSISCDECMFCDEDKNACRYAETARAGFYFGCYDVNYNDTNDPQKYLNDINLTFQDYADGRFETVEINSDNQNCFIIGYTTAWEIGYVHDLSYNKTGNPSFQDFTCGDYEFTN